MAMTTTAVRDGEPTSEINTTPLIDVMLVLLIMLIVSLPPQRDVISLNMPQKPPPIAEKPPEPIRIAISADGAMSWNGATISMAELNAKLDGVAASQPEIMIQPTRLVRYSSVIAVMAAVERRGIVKLGVVEGG